MLWTYDTVSSTHWQPKSFMLDSAAGVIALKWMRWGIRLVVAVAAVHAVFFVYMLIKMLTA